MLSRTLTLLLLGVAFSYASRCHLPEPQSGFTRESYSGFWYEVAKFQTAGGAYFEKDCVCTGLNVTIGDQAKYTVDNICRDKTPQGKVTSALENLFGEDPAHPGRFQASFFPLAPSVDYTILFLGNFTND